MAQEGSAIILIIFSVLALGGVAFALVLWDQERQKGQFQSKRIQSLTKTKKIKTFGSRTDGSAILSCPTGKQIDLLSATINLPNGQMCNNETTSQVYPTTQLKAYTDGANNIHISSDDWFRILTDPCPSKGTKVVHGSYVCSS